MGINGMMFSNTPFLSPQSLVKGIALAIVCASVVFSTDAPTAFASPITRIPGPVVDRIYFKAFDVDRAPLHLENGDMDLYLFGLKTNAATELRNNPNFKIFEAPASSVSIILNPAPAPSGQLNPFSIQKIRWAVQFLVNREFVAHEIYRGNALPMFTHVSPNDFDQLTISDLVHDYDIRYDPDLASRIITEEMTKAGAILDNGIWHYNSRPIRIKGVIRTEDERRLVGDLVRAELQTAGFQVEPSYQQFAPAILTVYSSDPVNLQWHFYTEGWGRSAPDRYDYSTINQMTAPWIGNMPGWQEAGFWQYENGTIDDLGKKLFTGAFSTQQERNGIYQELTGLAIEDSIRIWVVTVINSFAATANLVGTTEDLVSGPRSPWTLREAHIQGRVDLTVGNLWIWTERTTWNPIGGMTDLYSNEIWKNLHDPPIWNHPFTGLPMAVRSSFDVETAGPAKTLPVPQHSLKLDPSRDRWVPVGPNVTATSKVIFDYSKYFQSTWHHGVPITMADVIYSMYQRFDLAYDQNKSRIELALATTAKPQLDRFKGFRILDENRLEVYVDFWHFEDSYIAAYAIPSRLSMPWEILAAMDHLVFQQRLAAYSDTAASRFNVPWLSLVMDRHARLVKSAITEFADTDFDLSHLFMVGDLNLWNSLEARERYRRTLDWFGNHSLLVISNGPFMLTRYDPPAQFAELKAFRSPSYPFSKGDWLYGKPSLIEFLPITIPSLTINASNELIFQLKGPGTLGIHYLLFDPVARKVIDSGEAMDAGKDLFRITVNKQVSSALLPGIYQLYLTGYSNGISVVELQRIDIEASFQVMDEEATSAEATPISVGSTTGVSDNTRNPKQSGGCGSNAQPEFALLIAGLALFGLIRRTRMRNL